MDKPIKIELDRDEAHMLRYLAGKALQTAQQNKHRTKSDICYDLYEDDERIINGLIAKINED